MRARNVSTRNERRRSKSERTEDPAAQLGGERTAGQAIDEQPEDLVVRARVLPARPGPEVEAVRRGDLDQPLRRRDVVGSPGRANARIPDVVVQPARVVEELSDGDLTPVREKAGKPMLDRVGEVQLPLRD